MPNPHVDFVILEKATVMHFRLPPKVVQAIPDFQSLPSEHFVLNCNYRVLSQKTCKNSSAAERTSTSKGFEMITSKKFEMIQAMSANE